MISSSLRLCVRFNFPIFPYSYESAKKTYRLSQCCKIFNEKSVFFSRKSPFLQSYIIFGEVTSAAVSYFALLTHKLILIMALCLHIAIIVHACIFTRTLVRVHWSQCGVHLSEGRYAFSAVLSASTIALMHVLKIVYSSNCWLWCNNCYHCHVLDLNTSSKHKTTSSN